MARPVDARVRRKAYRPRKPRKAKAAKTATPRKPARTVAFRAHRGRGAGKVFKAHKPLRRAAGYRAHGKRALKGHGAKARTIRAVHAKKAKVRKMRRARLNLALIARR